MGEISNIVDLYLMNNPEILEEKLDDIQLSLVENTQLDLYSGHGYVTGNLSDSIKSDYTLDGLTGNIRGYIDGGTAPYGVYVDQGHELRDGSWWDGYEFMKTGVEETVALYG